MKDLKRMPRNVWFWIDRAVVVTMIFLACRFMAGAWNIWSEHDALVEEVAQLRQEIRAARQEVRDMKWRGDDLRWKVDLLEEQMDNGDLENAEKIEKLGEQDKALAETILLLVEDYFDTVMKTLQLEDLLHVLRQDHDAEAARLDALKAQQAIHTLYSGFPLGGCVMNTPVWGECRYALR